MCAAHRLKLSEPGPAVLTLTHLSHPTSHDTLVHTHTHTCASCCRYDFVIVSYDMLKDVAQVLEAIKFKVVILDESHCIKSPQVSTKVV